MPVNKSRQNTKYDLDKNIHGDTIPRHFTYQCRIMRKSSIYYQQHPKVKPSFKHPLKFLYDWWHQSPTTLTKKSPELLTVSQTHPIYPSFSLFYSTSHAVLPFFPFFALTTSRTTPLSSILDLENTMTQPKPMESLTLPTSKPSTSVPHCWYRFVPKYFPRWALHLLYIKGLNKTTFQRLFEDLLAANPSYHCYPNIARCTCNVYFK